MVDPLAVGIPLSGQLVRPLRDLLEVTRRLTSGYLTARVISNGGPSDGGGDESAQLVSDFNSLAVTLEDNHQVRQTCVTDISHESLTPLVFLQGQIEAMLDGVRFLDAASVEVFNRHVGQFKQLIYDLGQLSLTDAGSMTYQADALRLLPVLQESLEHCLPLAAKVGITLILKVEATTDDKFLGDLRRLRQLCGNLLTDSLRYTDAPGIVVVSLFNRADQLIVEISHAAPAVGVEHLAKLFDRLCRADTSRNLFTGGAGLSLSISKNIVLAQSGKI